MSIYEIAYEKVSSTYSHEFATQLHSAQLIAVYHSILNREKKKEFYKNTQLSLFI